jgi:hypothetical protein
MNVNLETKKKVIFACLYLFLSIVITGVLRGISYLNIIGFSGFSNSILVFIWVIEAIILIILIYAINKKLFKNRIARAPLLTLLVLLWTLIYATYEHFYTAHKGFMPYFLGCLEFAIFVPLPLFLFIGSILMLIIVNKKANKKE